jgi:hypothetical protein
LTFIIYISYNPDGLKKPGVGETEQFGMVKQALLYYEAIVFGVARQVIRISRPLYIFSGGIDKFFIAS